MKNARGWIAFEQHANDVLGLRATVASGNKWHDPGDGVDPRHYTETDFAIQIDAKYTEAGSFYLNAAKMYQWCQRAQGLGKRFALAVRFMPKWVDQPEDYVILRLDDFAELLSKLKEKEESNG
jgi:hypothetical protein